MFTNRSLGIVKGCPNPCIIEIKVEFFDDKQSNFKSGFISVNGITTGYFGVGGQAEFIEYVKNLDFNIANFQLISKTRNITKNGLSKNEVLKYLGKKAI